MRDGDSSSASSISNVIYTKKDLRLRYTTQMNDITSKQSTDQHHMYRDVSLYLTVINILPR